MESSEDAAIVGNDLEGLITTWNHGAEQIFGHTADEMVGTPISRCVPTERVEEERAIAAGAKRGERQHFDTVRQTKDGRLLEVSLAISPIKNQRGEVVGMANIARNISERVQNEHQIGRLSRLYASLSHLNKAVVSKCTRAELFE